MFKRRRWEATRGRLVAAGLANACSLIHDGHERLAERLPAEAKGRISAVMFNLGWLPGHDKNCITRAETTLIALQAAVDWLAPGGLLTIVLYPNHEGAASEARRVTDWALALSAKTFEARHMRSHYRAGLSPECWAIRKR